MPFIVNITKNFRIILRSNLENGFPMLGFYFPKWKMISQCWDSIFQNGKRFPNEDSIFQNGKQFPNVGISFSKMEDDFPHQIIVKTEVRHQFSDKIKPRLQQNG